MQWTETHCSMNVLLIITFIQPMKNFRRCIWLNLFHLIFSTDLLSTHNWFCFFCLSLPGTQWTILQIKNHEYTPANGTFRWKGHYSSKRQKKLMVGSAEAECYETNLEREKINWKQKILGSIFKIIMTRIIKGCFILLTKTHLLHLCLHCRQFETF